MPHSIPALTVNLRFPGAHFMPQLLRDPDMSVERERIKLN